MRWNFLKKLLRAAVSTESNKVSQLATIPISAIFGELAEIGMQHRYFINSTVKDQANGHVVPTRSRPTRAKRGENNMKSLRVKGGSITNAGYAVMAVRVCMGRIYALV